MRMRWTNPITPASAGLAASRYGATTPALLAWFRTFNADREYGDQIKPFNFLLAFHARPELALTDGRQWTPKRRRPGKPSPVRPVAPFNRGVGQAAKTALGPRNREEGRARPMPIEVPQQRARGQRTARCDGMSSPSDPSHRQ